MSFFCDFEKLFDETDGDYIKIDFAIGKGLFVVGNFKVEALDESQVCIISKHKKVQIDGEKLIIKSIAKGEICLLGNIFNISVGDKNDR